MNTVQKKRAYTSLLIIICCLYMYSVFSKKNTAAPIYLFMHNKSAKTLAVNSTSVVKFWDNYPYLVLASENEPIDLPSYILNQISLKTSKRIKELTDQPGTLYFRYYYSSVDEAISKHALELLSEISNPVLVLVDVKSKTNLDMELKKNAKKELLTTAIISNLPIELEKAKVSYFFRINNEKKLTDLFVPRKEIPQVTEKYIGEKL